MKTRIFVIAAAAFALCMAACQKEENLVPANGVNNVTNDLNGAAPKVQTTSDLDSTDWTHTTTYAEFLTNLLGANLCGLDQLENDILAFGLNFDGTYAHFSFPTEVEAWGGDENGMQQIYGVSYTYFYDGATHTGYLNGVAEDENGNDVPAQLQFTYDDATDVITFVLPMVFAEDGTPVNLTLNFNRNI